MFAERNHNELKFYRKFPNYTLLGGASLMLYVAGMSYNSPEFINEDVISKITIYGMGALSLIVLILQFFDYQKRREPKLIINQKGLWYDNSIWNNQGIFCTWSDIKHIRWARVGINIREIAVQSHTRSPFIIEVDNFDVPPKKVWEAIQIFCNDIYSND